MPSSEPTDHNTDSNAAPEPAAQPTLEEQLAAAKTEAGTAPKDLGKGDITPGTRALAEADARKKLEASGYRDLTNMKLDGKGVWSAETTVNGKRVTVQVDSQGDIVSK